MSSLESTIDTVTAPVLPTSLDPYGQLIKVLMPRAVGIAIFDREGMAMWISDGIENPDLQEVINETVSLASHPDTAAQVGAGFARAWNGDSAYIFVIRSPEGVIGYVGIIAPDTSQGARPFSTLHGLLRPALDVLARE